MCVQSPERNQLSLSVYPSNIFHIWRLKFLPLFSAKHLKLSQV